MPLGDVAEAAPMMAEFVELLRQHLAAATAQLAASQPAGQGAAAGAVLQ